MYVLAGVSGNVGSVAARALLAQGKKIRVLVRDAAKAGSWQKDAEVTQVALEDQAGLTRALAGAEAFFTLLPGDFAAPSFRDAQKKLGASIAAAVKDAKVPHTVLLSSIGADHDGPTGPILGLHWLEKALRATGTILSAVRPGYFQENVLGVVGAAKEQGIYPSFAPPDFPLPMIATKDIGAEVAKVLAAGAAKHNVVDVVGPGYTPTDVAATLGKVLGKQLLLVEVPPDQHVAAMVQAGLPQGIAELYAEMQAFFRSGKAGLAGDRMVQGTTTLEQTLRSRLS